MGTIHKPVRLSIDNPTLRNRFECMVANFMLWWAWRLFRHEPDKYFQEVKEITAMFYARIK